MDRRHQNRGKYNTVPWELISRQPMAGEQRARRTSRCSSHMMDKKIDDINHTGKSRETDLTRCKQRQCNLLPLILFYTKGVFSFLTNTKRNNSITTGQNDNATSQHSSASHRLDNILRELCKIHNSNRHHVTQIYASNDTLTSRNIQADGHYKYG